MHSVHMPLGDAHDGAVLGGAPEHVGGVGSDGDALDPPGVTAEDPRRLRRSHVVDADLTVGGARHDGRVIRVRQELAGNMVKSSTRLSSCYQFTSIEQYIS